MVGTLGDIVASLGIDRSRWDADTRKVQSDAKTMTRLLANMGEQWRVAQANRAASNKMLADMGRAGDTKARESALRMEVQREKEFVALLGQAVDEANNLADAQLKTESILNRARQPLQGLYGDFRRVRSEARGTEVAVSDMARAMGQSAAASSRMMSGMGMAGGQQRTRSILQQARQPMAFAGASQSDRGYRDFVSSVLVDERNAQRSAQGLVAYGRASRFAASAQQENARSTARGTYEILELGRGIEDAAIGYQINGWAGAFRGAANNIGVLLAAWGPWPMLIFSTGIALATALPHLWEWITGIQSEGDKTGELINIRERLLDTYNKQIDAQLRLRRAVDANATAQIIAAREEELLRVQAAIDAAEPQARSSAFQLAELTEQQNSPWRRSALENWEFNRRMQTEMPAALQTAADDAAVLRDAMRERQAIEEELVNLRSKLELQEHNEQMQRINDETVARIDGIRQARREAYDAGREQLLQQLNPQEAQRRRLEQEAEQRAAAFQDAMQAGNIDGLHFNRLMMANRLPIERQRAADELTTFREDNPFAGDRFSGAGQAQTIEAGSQEAFKLMDQNRRELADPMTQIRGISQQQLVTLNRILQRLTEQAEATVDVEAFEL